MNVTPVLFVVRLSGKNSNIDTDVVCFGKVTFNLTFSFNFNFIF